MQPFAITPSTEKDEEHGCALFAKACLGRCLVGRLRQLALFMAPLCGFVPFRGLSNEFRIRHIIGRSVSRDLFFGIAGKDHIRDGRDETAPYYDQHKFHVSELAQAACVPTPAVDSRPGSAEMAADRPVSVGISADLPFLTDPAMVELSEKEDATWTNSAALPQARQATVESAFLWPLSSLFWSCFMHSSQAGQSAQRSIRQVSVQPKNRHHLSRKSHQCSPSHQRLTTKKPATHRGTATGGRFIASAFGLSVPLSRQLAPMAVPAPRPSFPLMSKVHPC